MNEFYNEWDNNESLETLTKYCEICGRKIKLPNYAVNEFTGINETFHECALCQLDYLIDSYMEFKDQFERIDFHIDLLTQINELNQTLLIK